MKFLWNFSFHNFLRMCVSLLNEFCNFFECEIKDLQKVLDDPINKSNISSHLNGVWLRTTYKNRGGVKHLFQFGGLSLRDSKHLQAYNNFLAVTVLQHYYARHRIFVKNHNLPCVIEHTPHGDAHYFPIELLEIINNNCSCQDETDNDDEDDVKDVWKLKRKIITTQTIMVKKS